MHRSLRRGLYFTLPFAFAIGCGGVTDIDFQGDSTDGGGATGGSGGDGGGVVGGSGGTVDGGSGGLPTGGTGGGGAPAGGTGGGTGGAGLTCGGVQCETPTAPIQVDSCCAGDNGEKCGISSDLIGGQCIALGQEGTIDGTCPDQNFQGFPLQGCCKPTGNCGVFDSFLGLGCVDPSEFGLGQPGQKCGSVVVDAGTGGTGGGPTDAGTGGSPSDAGTPGATNCGITNPTVCTPSQNCCVLDPGLDYCSAKTTPCACTQPNCDILPVACDGPEDCPGQVCCGTFSFQQNAYTDLSCQASCTGQNEREICHPNGQTCSNPNETCSASQFLPSNIWRCN